MEMLPRKNVVSFARFFSAPDQKWKSVVPFCTVGVQAPSPQNGLFVLLDPSRRFLPDLIPYPSLNNRHGQIVFRTSFEH